MAKSSPLHKNSKPLVDLGKAIRNLRLQQGFSQESLALAAELDRSYIGGIERGEHNLSLMNLLKISHALKVDPSALLKKGKI